jgi:hypothetical protein
MKTTETTLSEKRVSRLRAQGYTRETKEELNGLAFGIRFAYRTCAAILTVAVLTQSIPLFGVMLGIAFLGIVLPNHPFDYIYNHILSGWMNRPKVPARSAQLKFACSMATAWIATVIYLLVAGHTTLGLAMAINLIVIAMFPATIDFCIPSAIYNALFKSKKAKTQTQSI